MFLKTRKTEAKSRTALRRHETVILANRRKNKLMSKERVLLGRWKGRVGQAPANDNPVPLDKDTELRLREIFQACSGPEEALDAARLAIAQVYPEGASQLAAELPSQAPALYEKRNKAKYKSPVEFFEDTWRDFKGSLYLDDLNRLDPKLAPAIRSYCQRLGYKDKDDNDLIPKNILPPVRPDRGTQITAEPGSVEYEVQRRKAAHRVRVANWQKRHRQAEP